MDYQLVQIKGFDLLCLKRINADYKSKIEMQKIFNKNNYFDIVTKYSPYLNGGDPLGTNSEAKIYHYEVSKRGNEELLPSFDYGMGTVFNGEDYTPDSEELPEPLDIIHILGGEYMKIVMPPECKTQSEFFGSVWEYLKKWGYIHEGDVMLTLVNVNDEKDCIRLLTVRKKGERLKKEDLKGEDSKSERSNRARLAKPKEDINQYAATQPLVVRDWITKMDQFMRGVGCNVQSKIVSNKVRTDAKFTYTSKKAKKTVCHINIGTSGCDISLRGFHFMFADGSVTILDEFPELAKKKPFACGCRKPDYSINPGSACVHGIAGTYTYKGEIYAKCAYSGFDYVLNEATNFALITRWIELESTFDGEVKPMQIKLGKIVEIERDEIDILDEYLNGQPKERCVNALWNVYNVMKKMAEDTTYKTTLGVLYSLCKNAVFKDENMKFLVCTDAFNPNKWLTDINYQYLPEKYGFVYSDIIFREGVTPKKKTDLRQIKQLTLSYSGNDFDDVILGMKMFVELNIKQAWPFFYEGDVRIFSK
ncbi:MAG: hypothetical protein FWD90_06740 [Defluviitaleaceae bacterium]|nr:hypothetical protein [Defluviitaleaceae bacterium]